MKVTYKGPGDTVELDGMSIKKGETVEVTSNQYQRMVASDPEAVVEVASSTSTPAKKKVD